MKRDISTPDPAYPDYECTLARAAGLPLWRQTAFRRLWAAQAVSGFGARITREGLPLAAILLTSASPAQLGLLAAFASGPGLIAGVLGGGYVDRARRRSVLIATDMLRGGVLLTIPLAAWTGWLTIPQLYIVAAIVGASSVLFGIADNAYLPSLVRPADLIDANSRINATDSVAEVGGPAIAGVLFQVVTAPIAILANTATYFASALLLSGIRVAETVSSEAAAPSLLHDASRGIRATWRHSVVRPLFLTATITTFFGSFFAAIYIYFAVEILGLTPAMLGLTIASGGAGAFVGSIAAPALARSFGAGRAFLIGAFGCGVATMLIPLAQGSPTSGMFILMGAQFFGDGLAVAAAIVATSLRQTLMPLTVMGRVSGIFYAGAGLAATLGALVGGMLAEIVGVRQTLVIAALGLIATPMWGFTTSLRRV